MKINFHRRTGIKPGLGVTLDDFGSGVVYGLRMGWALLTVTRTRSTNGR